MNILAVSIILAFIAIISCADDSNKTTSFDSLCRRGESDEYNEIKYVPIENIAKTLSDLAYTTLGMMEQFKDEYAQRLQAQDDFDTLLKSLEGKEWLRTFDWYQDEVLPKEKKLGTPVPSSYLETFNEKSDVILSKLHKVCQMIFIALVEMKDHGFDTYDADIVQYLKIYIDDSINSVKSILCTFTWFTDVSGVAEILESNTESDVPKITKDNNGLLYRDTLNFLEYLSQVFEYISQHNDTYIDTDEDIYADLESGTDSDTDEDTYPDIAPDTDPDTNPDTDPDTDPDPDTDADKDTDPDTDPDTAPDTDPDKDPDPDTDADKDI